jgi:23S rRNA (adenine2503-C2)-methyltransferase
LHAPDNALRDRLVPLNRRYPLDVLLPACREYVERTGRRITFEYILFVGVNDAPGQATRLAALLSGLNCHVNLIPGNPTPGFDFKPSPRPAVLAFESALRNAGVQCTVRQSRGRDIEAGCGQLRSRFQPGNTKA